MSESIVNWRRVAKADTFPIDQGACAKINNTQVAIFKFSSGEWYACQNMCPHKKEMVLSRGLIGDAGKEPKLACPMHKKTFSLKTGKNLNGEDFEIETYPVKVEGGDVYVKV